MNKGQSIRNTITVIFFFLITLSLYSQKGTYNITHLQVKDGLPSSEVYQAAQDKDGVIWFGTDAGVSKYDGYKFTNFTQNEGLSNNSAIRVHVDSENRVWILTMKSISCIEKDTFVDLKDWNVPQNTIIHYLKEDAYGNLWFVSKYKIFLLRDGTSEFELYKHPLICNPADPESIYHIKGVDNKGYIWFSEPDRYWELGINLKDAITTIRHYDLSAFSRMRYFIAPPDYFLSEDHIYRYSDKNELIKLNMPENKFKINTLTQLEEINEDQIVLATSESGLYFLDRKNNEFEIKTNILKNERITSFLRDREKNLWISTMGNGVFLVKQSSLNIDNYEIGNGISGKNVSSVFLQDDKLFLGYTNGKVDVKKNLTTINRLVLRQNRKGFEKVRNIISFGNRDVLFGSDSGISLYREGKMISSDLRFAVKDIWADNSNNLIIAEANRTCYVPKDEFDEFIRKEDPLDWETRVGRAYSAVIYKNEKYIGTTHGVFRSKGNEYEYLGEKDEIFKASISKLRLFQDSILIVLTDGAGIAFTTINQTHKINAKNGLSSNFCNNVFVDGNTIWISTNNGITKINNYEFLKNNHTARIIGYSDGLASNEVNDIKVAEGKVYVGTNKGLSVFDEADFMESVSKPSISITKFTSNGENKFNEHPINLNYDQTNIKIEFVGVNFQSVGQINYKYRMLGLDNEWQTTESNSVNYHELSAGNYKFEVKAVNSSKMESDQHASISFNVSKAFWKTWWFYTLLLVTGLSMAYFFNRLLFIEQQKKVLSKLVEDKTGELNKKIEELEFSNSKLFESNEQLEKFAYIASHDLQEPLRTIGSFITLLKRKYGDRLDETALEYIDFAVSGTKRMKMLIQSLLQYSRLESNAISFKNTDINDLLIIVIDSLRGIITSKNATVTYSELPVIWADPFQITQLLQNLINNAIKFNTSDHPKVHVSWSKIDKGYQFSISDNGIGIEKEFEDRIFSLFQRLNPSNEFPGTGVGLAICKKVVNRHNGGIWIEANKPTGAIFHFTICTSEAEKKEEKEKLMIID